MFTDQWTVHHARQPQASRRGNGDASTETTRDQSDRGQYVFNILFHPQHRFFAIKCLYHLLCQTSDRQTRVQNHWVVRQIGDRDIGFLCQCMMRRQRHHHAFAQYRLHHQIVLRWDQAIEADADTSLAQCLQLFVLGQVMQHDTDLGALGMEAREKTRDNVEHSRTKDADIQPTALPFASEHRLFFGALRQRQQIRHLYQQRLAGFRQHCTTRSAHEQRSADVLLQRLNLTRQRRLRHVQALGRTREVTFLGHREEVAHLFQIHSSPFLKSCYGVWSGKRSDRSNHRDDIHTLKVLEYKKSVLDSIAHQP